MWLRLSCRNALVCIHQMLVLGLSERMPHWSAKCPKYLLQEAALEEARFPNQCLEATVVLSFQSHRPFHQNQIVLCHLRNC